MTMSGNNVGDHARRAELRRDGQPSTSTTRDGLDAVHAATDLAGNAVASTAATESGHGRGLLMRSRLSLILNAVVAIAVLTVVFVGARGDNAAAFELVRASGALSLSNSSAGAAILDGRNLRPGVPVTGTVTIGNTGSGEAALAIEATGGRQHARRRRRLAVGRAAADDLRRHGRALPGRA